MNGRMNVFLKNVSWKDFVSLKIKSPMYLSGKNGRLSWFGIIYFTAYNLENKIIAS